MPKVSGEMWGPVAAPAEDADLAAGASVWIIPRQGGLGKAQPERHVLGMSLTPHTQVHWEYSSAIFSGLISLLTTLILRATVSCVLLALSLKSTSLRHYNLALPMFKILVFKVTFNLYISPRVPVIFINFLLKNLSLLTCEVSHNLNFANCISKELFKMFLWALYFLKTGSWIQSPDESSLWCLRQDQSWPVAHFRQEAQNVQVASFSRRQQLLLLWPTNSLGVAKWWHSIISFLVSSWNNFMKTCSLSSMIWLPSTAIHKGEAGQILESLFLSVFKIMNQGLSSSNSDWLVFFFK